MIMNKELKEQYMTACDLTGEREALKCLLGKMDVKFEVRSDGAISAKAGKKANEAFEIFNAWKEEKIAPIIAEQKARYMAGVDEKGEDEIRRIINSVTGNKAFDTMYYWRAERSEKFRLAALTEEERQAEEFDKQVFGIGVARNGKPYIKLPATIKVGETIQYKGVIFKTAGAGKVYQSGEIEIYNLYIEEEGWTATASGDYKFWNRKAVEEVGDYSRSFSRAMDDEGCVNYPSSTSLWAKVAESLKDQYIASERQIKVYLSSCGWGDYSPVEWTGSSKTPKDTFLAEARRLLSGGDADNPNQTDEELLAAFEKATNKA